MHAPLCLQAVVEINMDMVNQLTMMGFGTEGCKKAVFHNPNSVEAARQSHLLHRAAVCQKWLASKIWI